MTATFKVNDMTCRHCEKTVREALEKDMPEADVVIDIAERTVSVEGDASKAENVIRDAGYTPEAIAS